MTFYTARSLGAALAEKRKIKAERDQLRSALIWAMHQIDPCQCVQGEYAAAEKLVPQWREGSVRGEGEK